MIVTQTQKNPTYADIQISHLGKERKYLIRVVAHLVGTEEMSFQAQSGEQKRQRYLRLALEARELAATSPDNLRDSCLASAEQWERLAQRTSNVESSKPIHQITLYHQVRDWLRQHSGSCFCDECVARETETSRKNVSIATRRLGTEGDFSKYTGKCDSCGTSRAVTRATPEHF